MDYETKANELTKRMQVLEAGLTAVKSENASLHERIDQLYAVIDVLSKRADVLSERIDLRR